MVRVYETDGVTPHPLAVNDAAEVLRAGGLALYPTETVYGLGVAVRTREGVPGAYERIFSVKRRDTAQTVPWLVADASALDVYGVDVPKSAYVLAQRFWPGGLTIVVKASSAVPRVMQAADGTVALRVSRSPVVAALIRACRSPLATTSANTHGYPAPTSFAEVEERILHGVDLAVDAGATPLREASTIVSCVGASPQVLRHGALPETDIMQALGR